VRETRRWARRGPTLARRESRRRGGTYPLRNSDDAFLALIMAWHDYRGHSMGLNASRMAFGWPVCRYQALEAWVMAT